MERNNSVRSYDRCRRLVAHWTVFLIAQRYRCVDDDDDDDGHKKCKCDEFCETRSRFCDRTAGRAVAGEKYQTMARVHEEHRSIGTLFLPNSASLFKIVIGYCHRNINGRLNNSYGFVPWSGIYRTTKSKFPIDKYFRYTRKKTTFFPVQFFFLFCF